ncbi:hypothetical protein F2Q69_00031147 [Brassica cretica]|uniref:Uncharacterized protein n=1 Tax=Brassica cretica TaxID=69181 RepID=A0A8S9SC30_BRACR|nr:hypothetical protein F2Q69_00031147 [Brassica cretica]
MAGFREFQRQSLQQLRPNSFDQDDYDDFDVAVKIFESMGLPNDTKFYWACINEFREDIFWRMYFIDRAENTFEEKVQFLQALSEFTRDDQYMEKRLSSGKPFGSPSSGGVHSGSPSSGGNNSWGQTVNGQWGQQPRAPQWGTPPSSHQWGTPPTAQQWGTPPAAQQWAADMNNYRIKDPMPFGKQFMVEQFNKEFQLDITYKFFKEKLDTMKICTRNTKSF